MDRSLKGNNKNDNPCIRVEHVNKFFGKKQVLFDICH
jgi:hypothetical protein